MVYIVAYDISNHRTRARVARYLEKRGLRLQKSVFTLSVTQYAIKQIKKELAELVKQEGSIMIFRQCKGCQRLAIQSQKKSSKAVFL